MAPIKNGNVVHENEPEDTVLERVVKYIQAVPDPIATNSLVAYEFFIEDNAWRWSVGSVQSIVDNLVHVQEWRTHSGDHENLVKALYADLRNKEEELRKLQAAMMKAREDLSIIRRDNEGAMARARAAAESAKHRIEEMDEVEYQTFSNQQSPTLITRLILQAAILLAYDHIPDSWNDIRSISRTTAFTQRLRSYEATTEMSNEQRLEVRHRFLSDTDCSMDAAERNSAAATIILKWVNTQVELAEVHAKCGATQVHADRAQKTITQRIADMKALQAKMLQIRNQIKMYESGDFSHPDSSNCSTFTPSGETTTILRSSILSVLTDAGRDVVVLGLSEIEQLRDKASMSRPALLNALERALQDMASDTAAMAQQLTEAEALAADTEAQRDNISQQLDELRAAHKEMENELQNQRLRDTHWTRDIDKPIEYVTTHHSRDFEGDGWESLLHTKPEALCTAFATDAANACSVYTGDITNIAFTEDGLHAEFDVTHPADIPSSHFDQAIQQHPFRETWRLYDTRDAPKDGLDAAFEQQDNMQATLDGLQTEIDNLRAKNDNLEKQIEDLEKHDERWAAPAADAEKVVSHQTLKLPGDAKEWVKLAQERPEALRAAVIADVANACHVNPEDIDNLFVSEDGTTVEFDVHHVPQITKEQLPERLEKCPTRALDQLYAKRAEPKDGLDAALDEQERLQAALEQHAREIDAFRGTDEEKSAIIEDLMAHDERWAAPAADAEKIVSHQTLKLPGDAKEWVKLAQERPEALRAAVIADVANACHVNPEDIDNLFVSEDGTTVEFDVHHVPQITKEQLAERLEKCPTRALDQLYAKRAEPKDGLDAALDEQERLQAALEQHAREIDAFRGTDEEKSAIIEDLMAHDERWAAPAADAEKVVSHQTLKLPGDAKEWVKLAQERPEALRAAVIADVANACHVNPEDIDNLFVSEDGTTVEFDVHHVPQITKEQLAERLEKCPTRALDQLYAKRAEPKDGLDAALDEQERLQAALEQHAREIDAFRGTDEEKSAIIEDLMAHDERWAAPAADAEKIVSHQTLKLPGDAKEWVKLAQERPEALRAAVIADVANACHVNPEDIDNLFVSEDGTTVEFDVHHVPQITKEQLAERLEKCPTRALDQLYAKRAEPKDGLDAALDEQERLQAALEQHAREIDAFRGTDEEKSAIIADLMAHDERWAAPAADAEKVVSHQTLKLPGDAKEWVKLAQERPEALRAAVIADVANACHVNPEDIDNLFVSEDGTTVEFDVHHVPQITKEQLAERLEKCPTRALDQLYAKRAEPKDGLDAALDEQERLQAALEQHAREIDAFRGTDEEKSAIIADLMAHDERWAAPAADAEKIVSHQTLKLPGDAKEWVKLAQERPEALRAAVIADVANACHVNPEDIDNLFVSEDGTTVEFDVHHVPQITKEQLAERLEKCPTRALDQLYAKRAEPKDGLDAALDEQERLQAALEQHAREIDAFRGTDEEKSAIIEDLMAHDERWAAPAADAEKVVSHQTLKLPGDAKEWVKLAQERPEALRAAVIADVANACHVNPEDIDNLFVSEDGTTVEFDVHHVPQITKEQLAERLEKCPTRALDQLYAKRAEPKDGLDAALDEQERLQAALEQHAREIDAFRGTDEEKSAIIEDLMAHDERWAAPAADAEKIVSHQTLKLPGDAKEWVKLAQERPEALRAAVIADVANACHVNPEDIDNLFVSEDGTTVEFDVHHVPQITKEQLSERLEKCPTRALDQLYAKRAEPKDGLDAALDEQERLQAALEQHAREIDAFRGTDEEKSAIIEDLMAHDERWAAPAADAEKIVSHQILKLPGDAKEWVKLAQERPEALRAAVIADVANACHVNPEDIDNLFVSEDGTTVEFDVHHVPQITKEQLAERLEKCPTRALDQLYAKRAEPKDGLDAALDEQERLQAALEQHAREIDAFRGTDEEKSAIIADLMAHDERWAAPAADAEKVVSHQTLKLPGDAKEWVKLAQERPEALRAAVIADVANACHVNPEDIDNLFVSEDGTTVEFDVHHVPQITKEQLSERLEKCPTRALDQLYAKRAEPKDGLDAALDEQERLQAALEQHAREIDAFRGTDEEKSAIIEDLMAHDERWAAPAADAEKIVSHQTLKLPGDAKEWVKLAQERPEALRAAVIADVANACHVNPEDIDNLFVSEDGTTVEFDVHHVPQITKEQLAERLEKCPTRALDQLYAKRAEPKDGLDAALDEQERLQAALEQHAREIDAFRGTDEEKSAIIADLMAHDERWAAPAADAEKVVSHQTLKLPGDAKEWVKLAQERPEALRAAVIADVANACHVNPEDIDNLFVSEDGTTVEFDVHHVPQITKEQLSERLEKCPTRALDQLYAKRAEPKDGLDAALDEQERLQAALEQHAREIDAFRGTDEEKSAIIKDLMAHDERWAAPAADAEKIVSHQTLKLPGDAKEWVKLAQERPEALRAAVIADVANACHVNPEDIDNLFVSEDGTTVEFDVHHVPQITKEQLAERLEKCPTRALDQLYAKRAEPKDGVDALLEELAVLRAYDERWVAASADAEKVVSRVGLMLPGEGEEWVKLAQERPEALRAAVIADAANACHVNPEDIENLAVSEDGTTVEFDVRHVPDVTAEELAERLEKCPTRALDQLYAKREEPMDGLDAALNHCEFYISKVSELKESENVLKEALVVSAISGIIADECGSRLRIEKEEADSRLDQIVSVLRGVEDCSGDALDGLLSELELRASDGTDTLEKLEDFIGLLEVARAAERTAVQENAERSEELFNLQCLMDEERRANADHVEALQHEIDVYRRRLSDSGVDLCFTEAQAHADMVMLRSALESAHRDVTKLGQQVAFARQVNGEDGPPDMEELSRALDIKSRDYCETLGKLEEYARLLKQSRNSEIRLTDALHQKEADLFESKSLLEDVRTQSASEIESLRKELRLISKKLGVADRTEEVGVSINATGGNSSTSRINGWSDAPNSPLSAGQKEDSRSSIC